VSNAEAIDFPFLDDLPKGETLPEEIQEELERYRADFEEHEGLIIGAAVPALLQISQQRWSVIKKEFGFWCAEHFGKEWYSKKQLVAYYEKRTRKGGRPSHDTAKVIKAAFSEFK